MQPVLVMEILLERCQERYINKQLIQLLISYMNQQYILFKQAL